MNTIEKKVVKTGKYVNRAQVDTFIKGYKKNTWTHNSNRIGKEDALSCWYSVEDLEILLDKIKTHGGDGVRMYFGQYPEGYNNNAEFTDRQAIVMVGTRSSNGDYNTSKDIYVGKDNSIVAYIGDMPCPVYCVDPSKPLPHQKAPIGFTLVEGEQGLSVM